MLEADKISIINSFVKVVQLLRGVRKDLTKEIDTLKQANKEAAGIDDTNTDSLTTTLSAKKITDYITEKLTKLVQDEDAREETVKEMIEQLKSEAASTEGLLSISKAQALTKEQKAQVLANIGIDKEFLIGLLVDDESTIDSKNVLSAKKVTDLLAEAKIGFDIDEVVTDAELEEMLAVNSFVPKPAKPGQVLTSKVVDGKVALVWQDMFGSTEGEDDHGTQSGGSQTGGGESKPTTTPPSEVTGGQTQPDTGTGASSTEEKKNEESSGDAPSEGSDVQTSPKPPSTSPKVDEDAPVVNASPRADTAVSWDLNKIKFRDNDDKWLKENLSSRTAKFDESKIVHYIDFDITPTVDTSKPVRLGSINNGAMVPAMVSVAVGTGSIYKLPNDKYLYGVGLTVGQRVQGMLVLKYSDSVVSVSLEENTGEDYIYTNDPQDPRLDISNEAYNPNVRYKAGEIIPGGIVAEDEDDMPMPS